MKIVSRQEAIKLGLNRFFTGEPCKWGHIAERRADSSSCIKCLSETAIAWAKAHPEKIKLNLRKYRSSSKGKIKINKTRKIYMKKNEDRIRATYQKWYAQNGELKNSRNRTETGNAKRRARYIERSRSETQYRLQKQLRCRLKQAVRGRYRGGSAVRDLGCSIEFLCCYLERKFSPGMMWDNWGTVWHIDHIKPLAAFDLTSPQHIEVACNYTNLQPLFKRDNLAKAAKITQPFQLPFPWESANAYR